MISQKKIFFSSEDQNEDSDQEDEDDDDEEDNDELPIEKESRKLKKKQEKEAKEAEAELKINVDDKETFQLPSGQEIEQEKSRKYIFTKKIIIKKYFVLCLFFKIFFS